MPQWMPHLLPKSRDIPYRDLAFLEASLLSNTSQCSCGNIHTELSGHGNCTRFGRMPKLTMATPCSYEPPTISFELSDDLPHLHEVRVYVPRSAFFRPQTINAAIVNADTIAPTRNVHGSYHTCTSSSPGGTAQPRNVPLTRIGSTRAPLRSTFQPGHHGMLLTMSE